MNSVDQLMLPDVAGQAINRLAKQIAKHDIAVDATAAVAERAFFCAPVNCTITSVYYLPTTVSTPASGSNSQALLVQVYDGAGGAAASVAGKSVANATPTVALVKFSLGTLTNTALTAGKVLTFKTTLTGTATLPAGSIVVEYTVD